MAAASGEGRTAVGVASCSSDVGLESHGHSFLTEPGSASQGSLAALPPCVWRWSAFDGFHPHDLRILKGTLLLSWRGDKNRLKNCQSSSFFLVFTGRFGEGY